MENKNCNIILINIDGFRKDKIDLCPSLKFLKENSNYFSEISEISFLCSILFDLKSLTNLKIKQFENLFLKRINKHTLLKNEISNFLKHNDLIYCKLFKQLEI